MLSKKQFDDALDFLDTHEDALKCVDQIAEKQQTYLHYKNATGAIVAAMQNKEISVSGSQITGGANQEAFLYKRAFAEASQVFQKYKFAGASSRADFLKLLSTATGELQG